MRLAALAVILTLLAVPIAAIGLAYGFAIYKNIPAALQAIGRALRWLATPLTLPRLLVIVTGWKTWAIYNDDDMLRAIFWLIAFGLSVRWMQLVSELDRKFNEVTQQP